MENNIKADEDNKSNQQQQNGHQGDASPLSPSADSTKNVASLEEPQQPNCPPVEENAGESKQQNMTDNVALQCNGQVADATAAPKVHMSSTSVLVTTEMVATTEGASDDDLQLGEISNETLAISTTIEAPFEQQNLVQENLTTENIGADKETIKLNQRVGELKSQVKKLNVTITRDWRDLKKKSSKVEKIIATRQKNDYGAAKTMLAFRETAPAKENAAKQGEKIYDPAMQKASKMSKVKKKQQESPMRGPVMSCGGAELFYNGGSTSTAPSASTLSAASAGKINASMPEASPKKKKRFRERQSRRELLDQVEGLKEVLSQLALQNPHLKEQVTRLAAGNPKLQHLNLYPAAAVNGRERTDSECTVSSTVSSQVSRRATPKQRLVSDASIASTTSQKDSTTTTAPIGTVNNAEQKDRKRNKRKRNKTHKAAKSQASEEEMLAKYINTIVSEYLGELQQDRAVELQFKGGFEDLEAHAQRLCKAGLGRIVEDEIRINRKNNHQSFITMSTDRESGERDGIIILPVARRYAFEGDIVRAFVMNPGGMATAVSDSTATKCDIDEDKPKGNPISGGKDTSFSLAEDEDPFADETDSADSEGDPNELDATAVIVSDNCPKSFVISIVKQTEQRQVVGAISFKNATKLHGEKLYYKLKPHDMRIPMVYIPEVACVAHITPENKNDMCGFLYLAQVRETDVNGHCIGELLQPVGKVGNLEAEIKAILMHNGMKDLRPYEQRFNDLFAQPDSPMGEEDLHQREDLRKKCIFTIDPLTARDLDDAMSVERINDDTYEVGVHISDVSHYLQEDSELDNIVKDRATSIYLVTEVIHMLPQTLCFKCSLLPGEDKFAFSVFWRINMQGEILGEPRFTRSAINSCSQFAYEHAQKIIDNEGEEFDDDDFPTICNGFTPADIVSRVRVLHTMAQEMRKKRYDDGALSINNPKLRFHLDPKTGEPAGYNVDGRQEANFLIEEFMLQANQSVARFIYDRFPDIAILRNHAPPLAKSMKSLREKLANLGLKLDCSTSKTLYESMQCICNEANDPIAMDACLSAMLTKPMARAKYFCSEGKTAEADLWHYALSIPIYTHFTSPIRRYPDILVHRLLAAALNYCPPPKRTTDELHAMAKICNDQKYNAKMAGDESINLFFKRYIKSQQSITLRAVVTEIFQHLVNVVTIETGHAIAINYKMQKVLVNTANVPNFILIAEKNSTKPPLKLQLFSTVDIKLTVWNDKLCGFFVSPDPKQRQLNSIELSKNNKLQLAQAAANGASTSESTVENGGRKQRHNSAAGPATGAERNVSSTEKGKPKKNAKPSQQRVYALRASESN